MLYVSKFTALISFCFLILIACTHFSVFGLNNNNDSHVDFSLNKKIKYPYPITWIQNYENNNTNFLFIQTENGDIHQIESSSNIESKNASSLSQLSDQVYKVFASQDSGPLFVDWYGNQTVSNLISISKDGNMAIINISDNSIRWINNSELSPLTKPVSLSFEDRQIILAVSMDGILTYVDPQRDLVLKDRDFNNLLKDSRIVVSDLNNDSVDEVLILSTPSDRYPHGSLGDKSEAEQLMILKTCEKVIDNSDFKLCLKDTLNPPDNKIFESISPVVIELVISGNETRQIGLVASDDISGSNVVVYNLDSKPILTTQPIGKPFRWILILGDGNFNGNKLLINETPHLTGILKFIDPQGKTIIEIDGYSSHSFGTRNIDSAKIIKQKEMTCRDNSINSQENDNYGDNDFIVIPNLARDSLSMLYVDADNQVEVLDRMLLESSITSNTVAEDINGDNILDILVGDELGNLYVFTCNQISDKYTN